MSEYLNAGWRSGKSGANEQAMHLMACAPRLLAALKELDDLLSFDSPIEAGRENGWNFSDTGLINAAIAEARAAIAEAEGK